jgi:hypothetical protein
LLKIGRSQGIRILNAFIEKAKLEDCELNWNLVEQWLLLISPKLKPRADWKAQQIEALGVEPLDSDWLNADLNA